MADFSTTLVALRTSLGLTQEQLASRLSQTKGAVSKWEQNKGKPDRASVAKLFRMAHPPICWDLLSAAGISLKLVQRKLQDYAEYLDAEGASKQLRHLELELERLQAHKDREEKRRGRKGGFKNVALTQENHTHKRTS